MSPLDSKLRKVTPSDCSASHLLDRNLETELNKLIVTHQLQDIFKLKGYAVWSFFVIEENNTFDVWELKTLYAQEMCKRGIFSLGAHNISFAHTKDHIDSLLIAYDAYFDIVNSARKSGLKEKLNCDVLKPLFKVR